MFFTFLNKENANSVDFSVMQKYSPEKVLFYLYNSSLTISLATYLELQSTLESKKSNKQLTKWHKFFNQLDVQTDLDIFQQNEFLTTLGPYYYPFTNTRVYFTKNNISSNNLLTIEDLDILTSLHSTPEMNKELQSYYKSLNKNTKKSKGKEDLIKDIKMCIKALSETEIINRHINYLNKLLESRYSLVEIQDLNPLEPDNIPVKPVTLEKKHPSRDNVIPFTKLKFKNKSEDKEAVNFNHDMKVYFIRYREYEKACDRYKMYLSDWPNYYKALMNKCYSDIDIAEEKLKKALSFLDIYNSIILKSKIHPNYQDISILQTFIYYLETGRCNDLQDCMNLFEEEKHWEEIKASQTRIENTIYFLQTETDLTRFADENINQYLKQFNEAAASLNSPNEK